jgi:peptidoglycan/xylan/chitin deacetylase (PgdA/CDA1 family)
LTAKEAGLGFAARGKRWLKPLARTGVLRAASVLCAPGAAILMYHSVMDNPEEHGAAFGGIIHSTSVFAGQMEVLARYYHPVALDDLVEILAGRKSLPRRAVVVTFDDGYADNCDIAAPVLNRIGIPAAFYVVVNSIARGRLPWPIRVRHAFLSTRLAIWTDPGARRWPLATPDNRLDAFAAACVDCGRLAGEAQEGAVVAIEQQLDSTPYAADQQLMMSWEQLQTLKRQGHVVGSHTVSHPNLAQLAEREAEQELVDSKQTLEQRLSQPVWHFSYPNPVLDPHWTEQTAALSQRVGYRTAVTSRRGLVRQKDNPFGLSRILPTKQVDGLRWNLECAFAGYTRS